MPALDLCDDISSKFPKVDWKILTAELVRSLELALVVEGRKVSEKVSHAVAENLCHAITHVQVESRGKNDQVCRNLAPVCETKAILGVMGECGIRLHLDLSQRLRMYL